MDISDSMTDTLPDAQTSKQTSDDTTPLVEESLASQDTGNLESPSSGAQMGSTDAPYAKTQQYGPDDGGGDTPSSFPIPVNSSQASNLVLRNTVPATPTFQRRSTAAIAPNRAQQTPSTLRPTTGSRIFGKFASQDYHVMRSSIILFPLSFVSPRDEARFYNRIVQTFEIRARIATIASLVMFLVYWICTAVCLSLSIFPSSGSPVQVMYSICMFLVLLSSIVPYIASAASSFRNHIETLLYISVLLTAIVIGAWVVTNAVLQFSNDFQKTKIWLNIYIYIIPFWSSMLLDIVMQARTKTSFTVHVAVYGIFSTVNVIQTAIYIKKTQTYIKTTSDKTDFLVVSTLLDCFFGFTITALLFMGRWFLELQERVEFLRRMRAADQIRRLKDTSAKKKRKKGATIVEDLTTLVEKVLHNINEVLIETNLPSLVEGSELLKQCQDILTNTDNLYSVRYQAKSQGLEEEALEEQFLQIYADKQFCHLPTRVRFGEVTGIQYDSEAAAKDISRNEYFEQKGTLRSFGLLHLHDPLKRNFGVPVLAPVPALSSVDAIRIGRDWDTDILQLAATHPNILLEVGTVLLCDKLDSVRSTPHCLFNYLYKLQSCYPPNPYHNQIHGAAVAHATSCLMRMLLVHEAADHSNINDIGVIIAALGHDAGHPGRNNLFFVNTSNNLALIYNDSSVLENVHSAITFKCLETAGANIFADTTPEVFRNIRKRIIELILTTDMGHHFESVSRFRLRRQAVGFDYMQEVDDMWLVIRMCIKCADLSHALVDWRQHLDWSLRVVEEFYQQGEHEVELGLKVSPLCDRGSHSDFAKSQKGFIEFVVQPLLSQMEELHHGTSIGSECVRHLMFNKAKWDEWASELYVPPIPEEYKNMKTDAFSSVQTLVSLYIKGQKLVPLREAQPVETSKPKMSEDDKLDSSAEAPNENVAPTLSGEKSVEKVSDVTASNGTSSETSLDLTSPAS